MPSVVESKVACKVGKAARVNYGHSSKSHTKKTMDKKTMQRQRCLAQKARQAGSTVMNQGDGSNGAAAASAVKVAKKLTKAMIASKCRRVSCGAMPNDSTLDGKWGSYDTVPVKGVLTRMAVGDCCNKCAPAYRSAYSHLQTWEECADECNASVENDCEFQKTIDVKDGGEAVTWYRSTVTSGKDFGVETAIWLRSVRPIDVFNRFGKPLDVLGYPLKDCDSPDSNKFKGITVVDDGKWGTAGVSHKYFKQFRTTEDEFRQELSDHIRAESTEELMSFLT